MEMEQALIALFGVQTTALSKILESNQTAERFGVVLSESQAIKLLEVQRQAVKSTGRLEFGEGVVHKFAIAFCDSPYLSRTEYEDTLRALIQMFYELKNESADRFGDDDLIDQMRKLFDRGFGSMELLQDTSIEQFVYNIRSGTVDDKVDDKENDKLWMDGGEQEWD